MVFLREQLDEDERVIRSNSLELWPGDFLRRIADEHERDPGHFAWKPHDVSPQRIAHILRFDPRRMLAEVEAKREILRRFETAQDAAAVADGTILSGAAKLRVATLEIAVRALLIPYADRPGYDPAWKVDS